MRRRLKLELLFFTLAIICVLPWKSDAFAQTQLDARVAWCFAEIEFRLGRERDYLEALLKNKPARPNLPLRSKEELREMLIANSHDDSIAQWQEQLKTTELLYRRYQRFLLLRNAQTNSSEEFVATLLASKANQRDDSERLTSCDKRFRCLEKSHEFIMNQLRENGSRFDNSGQLSTTSSDTAGRTLDDVYQVCLRQCGDAVVSVFNRKKTCLDPTWLH